MNEITLGTELKFRAKAAASSGSKLTKETKDLVKKCKAMKVRTRDLEEANTNLTKTAMKAALKVGGNAPVNSGNN